MVPNFIFDILDAYLEPHISNTLRDQVLEFCTVKDFDLYNNPTKNQRSCASRFCGGRPQSWTK